MDDHASTSRIDRSGRFVPWQVHDHHTASAFTLAGISLASLFVPMGLGTVAEWSWLAGVVLVGLAVVAVGMSLRSGSERRGGSTG